MASVIPSNRAPFDLDTLAEVTHGAIAYRGRSPHAIGVSTDSRSVVENSVFVALQGERFDGHEHIAQAAARGASIIVASRPVPPSEHGEASVVQVSDTLEALGWLGRAHLRRWRKTHPVATTPIVAVAGSAGKTTTRRALTAGLRAIGKRVHAPVGNLNNLVGIPMVLLSLDETHDAVVVEVGTNAPGEVSRGAALVEPTVSVLTLVAREHTEGLGDLDEIAREEGAILEALSTMDRAGESVLAVVNADDPRCVSHELRARTPRRATWSAYGESDRADTRIVARDPIGLDGTRLRLEVRDAIAPSTSMSSSTHTASRDSTHTAPGVRVTTLEIVTPLLGKAGALATAAAIAVASRYTSSVLSSESFSTAFSTLRDEHEPGRLAPITLPGGAVLIDDSYNANRASAEASIQAAKELADLLARRLILVLGEMRELGAFSHEEHDGVGAAVMAARPDALVAVNGDAERIHRIAREAGISSTFVATSADALPLVRELVSPTALVLFKGSRGVGLDRVVQALTGDEAHT